MRRHVGKFRLHFMMPFLMAGIGCVTAIDHRVQEFNNDGVTQFARGDFRAAQESFEVALTLTPQDPALLYNLGQCRDRQGDWRGAEQYYLTCLQLAPTHGDARQAQVSILYRTGRAQEANRLIQEWLEQHPTSADAYVLDAWRCARTRRCRWRRGVCTRRLPWSRIIAGDWWSLVSFTKC